METHPVIKIIKTRMRKDDRISESQIKDYKRRLERSEFLVFHVEMLQEYQNRIIRLRKLLNEKEEEIKQYEISLKIQAQKASKAEQFLLETYGRKSSEWEQYQSFIVNN